MPNDKVLHEKLDKLLSAQNECTKDIAVIKQDIKGFRELFGEYKAKVNKIENRQWKLSSATAAISALIAYFFKK